MAHDLEDYKGLAQTMVDAYNLASTGRQGADVGAGALLGLFVNLAIYIMNYPTMKAAKIAGIYNQLYIALNKAKPGSEYTIDVMRQDRELNALSKYIYDKSPLNDRQAEYVGQEFRRIRDIVTIWNVSSLDCTECGQPGDVCKAQGCLKG